MTARREDPMDDDKISYEEDEDRERERDEEEIEDDEPKEDE